MLIYRPSCYLFQVCVATKSCVGRVPRGNMQTGFRMFRFYQRHASLTYSGMLLSRIFNPSHLPLRRLAAPLLTTNRVLLVNMSIFNASRLQNKTVLITGASGGIGEVGGRN